MSHLLALGGDIFALMIMWRARRWVLGGRQGMFETETDARLRKWAGIFVWIICLASIVANHLLFNF